MTSRNQISGSHITSFIPAVREKLQEKPERLVTRHLPLVTALLVGTARFELATPCTPSKCATRLRYVPIKQVTRYRR